MGAIGAGKITADRVTARPTYRRCKRCGYITLTALADDGPAVPGIRANLDPRPLTTLGELQALVLGLVTYHRTGGHLGWRDPITISRRPASDATVHHTHVCHPLPPIDYAPPPARVRVADTDPTHPPF